MRKLWLILLLSLVLSPSCKTIGFDYQIIPPTCEEEEMLKVCTSSIVEGETASVQSDYDAYRRFAPNAGGPP